MVDCPARARPFVQAGAWARPYFLEGVDDLRGAVDGAISVTYDLPGVAVVNDGVKCLSSGRVRPEHPEPNGSGGDEHGFCDSFHIILPS